MSSFLSRFLHWKACPSSVPTILIGQTSIRFFVCQIFPINYCIALWYLIRTRRSHGSCKWKICLYKLLRRIIRFYYSVSNRLQLDMFDQANRSLPFGDDIINEFMMYSLGVPLSRNYMSNVFDVVNQRIWRTYNIHPGNSSRKCSRH